MQINIISERKSVDYVEEALKDAPLPAPAFHRPVLTIFEEMFQGNRDRPAYLARHWAKLLRERWFVGVVRAELEIEGWGSRRWRRAGSNQPPGAPHSLIVKALGDGADLRLDGQKGIEHLGIEGAAAHLAHHLQ